MPLVTLNVSLIVWRVPNETSAESVSRMRAAEIEPMAAARAASRVRPMVISGVDSATLGRNVGAGVHVTQTAAMRAREEGSSRRMLFYPDGNGFDGSEY